MQLEERFLNSAIEYKNKYFKIIYIFILLTALLFFIISTYLTLKIFVIILMGNTNKGFIPLDNNIKQSNVNNKQIDTRNDNLYNWRQCNRNLMANVTRSCLVEKIKNPFIYPDNENERYVQCINSLTMNPYFIKIIKEYIDMIKEDICNNPYLSNIKSQQWFNTPIENIIYNN